jgi:hypothetical protein
MENNEQTLRDQWHSSSYEFTPPVTEVLSSMRRRHRRRSAVTALGAVAGVVLVTGVGFALVNQPDAGPAGMPAAAGTASSPVSLLGVPGHLRQVAGEEAVIKGAPEPADGEKLFYKGESGAGMITVRVVIDPAVMPGLPPSESVAIPWAVGPGSPQFSLHDTGTTTYLLAFTTSGKDWFLVAGGADRAIRIDVLSAFATANIT